MTIGLELFTLMFSSLSHEIRRWKKSVAKRILQKYLQNMDLLCSHNQNYVQQLVIVLRF